MTAAHSTTQHVAQHALTGTDKIAADQLIAKLQAPKTGAHRALTTRELKKAAKAAGNAAERLNLAVATVEAPKVSLRERAASAAKAAKALRPSRPSFLTVVPSTPIADSIATKVTNTGKADFIVDSSGSIGRTVMQHTATGYVTVARTAQDAAEQLYPTRGFAGLLDDIVATPEQRIRKANVHAVVQTAALLAPLAAKLAVKLAK